MPNLRLERKCPFCKTVSVVWTDADAYESWQRGTLIQRAFPNMHIDDREVLITGLCIKCQSEVFCEED